MNQPTTQRDLTSVWLGVTAVSIFILLALTIGFIVHKADKKQANKVPAKVWAWERCPFPLPVSAMGSHAESMKKAVSSVNRQILHLGYGDIFVQRTERLSAPVLINWVDAPKQLTLPGEMCAPFAKTQQQDDGLPQAMVDFRFLAPGNQLINADMFFCADKYRQATAKPRRPLDRHWVRLRPVEVYATHELGHVLFGPDHLGTGCGVLCKEPVTATFSAMEKQLLQKIYNPLCRKDGEL